MLAVAELIGQGIDIDAPACRGMFQAAHIDIPHIRIGPRAIERLHATGFAEIVLGAQRPEFVKLEIVETGQELEPRLLNVMVKESLHRAVRAIADAVSLGFEIGLHRIRHLATMALAKILLPHCCLTLLSAIERTDQSSMS
jgi:hypothetical protein